MREWNLKPGSPLSLTLAADARLGPTDYNDDQIWELSLGGGDPPALALQTTYGLRARALRLFPRFTEGDEVRTAPADFAHPVLIRHIFPNFIAVTFSPFTDIDVESEYWVPLSKGAAGRLRLVNRGKEPRQIRLEWVAQLTPTEGERMAPTEMNAAPLLAGRTGDLQPVVFLTGGPQGSITTYPSLNLVVDLPPGGSRQFHWSTAALPGVEESFALARRLAARRMDAERARLELLNAGGVDIYTGDPDWDAAFHLAQKVAFGLFAGPTEHLPYPSFVLTRQPDQGYSLRGDGADYNHLWNGQPPLEAYYLASLILPSASALAEGILRNYLAVQTETGFIDWKPGLAGQRSRLLATPMLASLAWRIYESTENRDFLEEVYPGLLRFVQAWFTPQHDRDADGVPEWDHPMQSGSEDHPLYSRWQAWAQGADISTSEGPALCSFLYKECETLVRIAGLIGCTEDVPELQARAENLRTAVEISWNEDESSYHDWDRDTHYKTRREWLGEHLGPGEILVNRQFEQPIRLQLRVHTDGESTRRPQIVIYGAGATGNKRVERLGDESFKWYLGDGSLTGDRVYSYLERVEVQGLDAQDTIELYSVGYDHQDQSLLLPLWAGIPAEERARLLVQETVTSPLKYWQQFGIPACAVPPDTTEAGVCRSVHPPWNALVGEGLLRYGYRAEAAELVSKVMAAIVQTLKGEAGFRRYYHADTGQGLGDPNALNGLAPLGLFLETLGVRLISPRRVALSGFNPFPWPVTVKYRGMTVLRQKEKSMVIFPDGQTVVVEDPAPRLISLEAE